MTDENLLEEKCSCGASIKVALSTQVGVAEERKQLLSRVDAWRALHDRCLPQILVCRPLQPYRQTPDRESTGAVSGPPLQAVDFEALRDYIGELQQEAAQESGQCSRSEAALAALGLLFSMQTAVGLGAAERAERCEHGLRLSVSCYCCKRQVRFNIE